MQLPEGQMDLPNVAFIGKMGAGKTAAAKILVGLGYDLVPFNAGIYDVANLIWDEPTRGQMQQLGQKVREIDQDAWVNVCLRRMDETTALLGPGLRFVNDSARFPNEYWALRERGFVFVRLYADEDVRVDRLLRIGKLEDRSQLYDVTEIMLDDVEADYTIDNMGTHDDLAEEVLRVLNREAARA